MKNKIKITLAMLVVLAMSIALFSCTGKTDDTTTAADVTTIADATTAADDTVTETEAETETETETETDAAADLPFIYVTIYDGESVVAVNEKVAKSDEDNDEKWTINDALIALHNDKCKDGFATEDQGHGPMIVKLWGKENGGSFGYYKNNQMCMSLFEELTEADHLYAYAYSDAKGYSDAYSFFDQYSVSGNAGEKVTLTLKYISGFDENYAPIESALADAVIVIGGENTELKTGEDGTVEIQLPADSAVISAVKDGVLLIPPVCEYVK